MAKWKPKYKLKVGDLVRITDEAIRYQVVEGRPNIGIIMSKPYCYVETSCEGPDMDASMVELEHWCYDIYFENKITKMFPEDFIEPLKIKEDK